MNNYKKYTLPVNPVFKIIFSFVILIVAGAFILSMPVSLVKEIKFIDALFISTSAVCVTGLVTVDVPGVFSHFGQFIIAVLIQLGGLGVMTISVTFAFLLGRKLSVRWQFALMDLYSVHSKLPIKSILRRILLFSFVVETIAAALLFPEFYSARGNISQGLWDAVFHSISAFCNAGFSLYSDNMMGFSHNKLVLSVISAEIIFGGVGFFVMSEIVHNIYLLGKYRNIKNHPQITLSLHSKIVLTATLFLIIAGASVFFLLERGNSLSNMNLLDKIINSFFQSITCRTAGFNTVEIASLRETSLFLMVGLMFIGGSPGSIAGGVKTTTFWLTLSLIYSKFKGAVDLVLWKRTIDKETLEKAMTLLILALFFVSVSTFFLIYFDAFKIKNIFLSSLFEITSAFGTVGLSVGITPQMTVLGKILTCIVMLTGRLGPLTLFASLTFNQKTVSLKYPKENIMVG
ncbi:MAG TPA: potassium transporter TrkG [Spirochaetota bacterium]|nr:potassium transporter TrkG [Spirochaetota bacterium]HOR45541.1 potassium transporter TrkG [Spirochaetota bacterium]HPK56966.1 potassium transporter TrkG [Spirochaetota bacterium]